MNSIFPLVLLLAGHSLGAAQLTPSPLQVTIEGQDVVFKAQICLDEDAAGPLDPKPRGLPCMQVEMTYTSLTGGGGDLVLLQTTDLEGRVGIPAGFRPLFADIYGLRSVDIEVIQQVTAFGVQADFSPVTSVDFRATPFWIIGGPEAWIIQSAHLNAFYHAQHAFEVLRAKVGPPPAMPIQLKFMRDQDSPHDEDAAPNVADYMTFSLGQQIVERVLHIWGAASPDQALAARSGTTIAHEVAHHFLHPIGLHTQESGSPLCLAPSDHFNEGLSDYLACVVTGHDYVALGVPHVTPRLVHNNPGPRYNQVQACGIWSAHLRGLLVGGALLDSRRRFAADTAGEVLFDVMARHALERLRAIVPNLDHLQDFPDERAVLQFLLEANSDERSRRILYQTFSVEGGVPWPEATVPTGFGATIPVLEATRVASGLQIAIRGAPAGVPVLVLGSLDPSEPWVLGQASLYLDPLSLRVLGSPVTSSLGSASFALPLSAAAIGLDVALTAVVPPSSGSRAVSDGVRIRL